MHDTIAFFLLGIPVVLDVTDGVAAERLRVSYALCPAADPRTPDAIRGTLQIEAGTFVARVFDRPETRTPDLVTAVRAINHELLFAIMLRDRRYVCVHAGVVAIGDIGVVLPGVSHAGKSTLALALVRAGADFLSDELFVLDPESDQARAYPRAVKIRDCCLHYFDDSKAFFTGEGEGRYLRPAGLFPGRLRESATIGAIVTARWNAQRPTVITPEPGGRAFLALTESAMNFGSHGTQTIDHLARTVAGSRNFTLEWRDAHEAARAITDAVRATSTA